LVEQGLQVACAVEHANDFDSAFARQVEDNVAAKGKASQVSEQFWPRAADQGTPGKASNLAINGSGKGVGLARTVLGDVGPNLGEVLQCLRAYYNRRHFI
jgi:hypothetical protein